MIPAGMIVLVLGGVCTHIIFWDRHNVGAGVLALAGVVFGMFWLLVPTVLFGHAFGFTTGQVLTLVGLTLGVIVLITTVVLRERILRSVGFKWVLIFVYFSLPSISRIVTSFYGCETFDAGDEGGTSSRTTFTTSSRPSSRRRCGRSTRTRARSCPRRSSTR